MQLGGVMPHNQLVLTPVGSIGASGDNPEAVDLQLHEFERSKAFKLDRVHREIRDYNLKSFKSRRER
ncbi:unnamed protein product [Sphagnum balticum]